MVSQYFFLFCFVFENIQYILIIVFPPSALPRSSTPIQILPLLCRQVTSVSQQLCAQADVSLSPPVLCTVPFFSTMSSTLQGEGFR